MSLARRILDEANEDIRTSELYQTFMDNVHIIVGCLEKLKKEFDSAHSDTRVQDFENLGQLYQTLDTIVTVLDKSGFTYIPQPVNFNRRQLHSIFGNFIDFYEEYANGFAAEDLEILNTNTKDLMSILEKLKQD